MMTELDMYKELEKMNLLDSDDELEYRRLRTAPPSTGRFTKSSSSTFLSNQASENVKSLFATSASSSNSSSVPSASRSFDDGGDGAHNDGGASTEKMSAKGRQSTYEGKYTYEGSLKKVPTKACITKRRRRTMETKESNIKRQRKQNTNKSNITRTLTTKQ